MEITPDSTNALINGCQDPNRSVTFSLTSDSYAPGGVTWSITPSGLAGGATISDGTVAIGDVVTNYTITAASIDNTNCSDTSTLALERDCVCSNHVIGAEMDVPDLKGCGLTDYWLNDPIPDKCNNNVQIMCTGAPAAGVKYYHNGGLVGYCPYNPSSWWAWYWKCQCGAVIMKAKFWVENGDDDPPGLGSGKEEIWQCGVGNEKWCYSTTNSVRITRTCTTAD